MITGGSQDYFRGGQGINFQPKPMGEIQEVSSINVSSKMMSEKKKNPKAADLDAYGVVPRSSSQQKMKQAGTQRQTIGQLKNQKHQSQFVNMQQEILNSKAYYLQLTEAWDQSSRGGNAIPYYHQVRFIEALSELKFPDMNQIMKKEITDLRAGKA